MVEPAYKTQLEGFPRRLVEDGIVSEDVIVNAIRASRDAGESLIAYLIRQGIADASAIANSAAAEYLLPLVDIEAFAVDREAVLAVDPNLIIEHRVLPIALRAKRLYLAIADPAYLQLLDDISLQTGLRTFAVIVAQDKLNVAIEEARYFNKATDEFCLDLGSASWREVVPVLHRLGALVGQVTEEKVGIQTQE